MADSDDSLFNLDIVRDFILSKGGKTTNHQLVTHFKSFLNDPQRKVAHRQKFKEIVNTLAIVKLDESGEKVLQLKKKYREGHASFSSAASSVDASPLYQDLPRNRPKAKKAKLADQFESSTISAADSLMTPSSSGEPLDFSGAVSEGPSCLVESPSTESEPSLSEMISGELSARRYGGGDGASSEESKTSPETDEERIIGELETPSTVASVEICAEEPQVVMEPEQAPPEEEEVVEHAEALPAGPVVPEGVMDERDDVDSGVGEGTGSVAPESLAGDSVAGGSIADNADLRSEVSDEGRGSVVMETTAPEPMVAMVASPAVSTQNSELEDSIISVKQRAQHLNRMESQNNLIEGAASGGKKKERPGKGAGADDDDTSSDNSITISLTDVERKWMVDAAQANYQELSKALINQPRLSKYKDFTSGYTALHWAAKHGNLDIVKLLCGSKEGAGINAQTHGGYSALHLASIQGHEDVIELLVQVYKADPDIRDYSGRKPKQYLRHSASSRSQQLLQPRRLRTSIVTGTSSSQTVFRRTGSYSSKIRSVGGAPFGIQGGAALRTSWTDRQPLPGTAKEEPILRQTSVEQDMMPPPRGVPLRRHRSKKGDSRENLSDSELPPGTMMPTRSGSDSQLVIQTETGV